MRTDPFFYDQPEKKFVERLKTPVHESRPINFGKGKLSSGLVSVDGIYVAEKFEGDEGLLETAYNDFDAFLKVCGIGENRYPLKIRRVPTGSISGYESYRITVTQDDALIEAEDTEGARRAIIYLEGEMTKNEGAFLSLGICSARPHIKNRITRGFFSPTNRPPLYGDELLDEVDYYPDEYLNRLAHSATNGLWIYTSFRALIASPCFNDDKEKCEKRLNKLTKVVKKCKKYGVKVFIFAIEPHGLGGDDARANPDMISGNFFEGKSPICLRLPKAREYLVSTVRELFTRIPDLGGYIDITAGERVTSCPSLSSYRECPRCSHYSRGENLALTANLIKEGMRAAKTDAEFISWTYGHRYWDYADIAEYVEKTDSDVVFMQNFEDRGYDEQLGKKRIAYDYWLSYKGPSELFENTAKYTSREGKSLYAKMQVCCSHELATVPYLPVPGIIFDKYKRARELGVTGVMECWYFGNYPSVMSRCAGAMSFADDLSDKNAFLLDFAARNYGKSVAERMIGAWETFEAGYVNYPTNIMFSYYGPMHDGVVWELSLKPKNNPLPRSWQLTDVPDGDRIGECIWNGHTLEEAIILSEEMRDEWQRGLALYPLTEEDESYTVAAALGILFSSGSNVLNFYKLRSELGIEASDTKEILDKMRLIVKDEIENSKKMILLCRKDNRLGYHSEAEGYKFFEEKLLHRIDSLKNLLLTEFIEVEERIDSGLHPLGYYYAEGERCYRLDGKPIKLGDGRCISVRIDGDSLLYSVMARSGDEVQIGQEFKLFEPEAAIVVCDTYDEKKTVHPESLTVYKRGLRLDDGATSHQSVWGDKIIAELQKYEHKMHREGDKVYHEIRAKIPKEKWNKMTAIRLRIVVGDYYLSPSSEPTITLGKKAFSPDEFAFFTV